MDILNKQRMIKSQLRYKNLVFKYNESCDEIVNPYIFKIDGTLGERFCDETIQLFEESKRYWYKGENDTDKEASTGLSISNKKSVEINISHLETQNPEEEIKDPEEVKRKWLEVDKTLHYVLTKQLQKYIEHLKINCNNIRLWKICERKLLRDTGYKMKKHKKNEGFNSWHIDAHPGSSAGKSRDRIIAFIWFLNTVEEGGEIEMYTGEKIKTERGKLIFFPANWTYTYNSTMPISEDKYFISGWMKSIEGEDF